ncbi:MAG TPA: bacillithiol biosynthesis cysteine-adding enzyme BshC [Candidatus Angelobacter sp.]|nr:bacillithiol biosynthesis cysteine-adding enzyme BshC [Candidatus Angelobacter sp.]
MDFECLAFSSIPHTSRLFQDFLHHFERVRNFYARPPLDDAWWSEEKQRIEYPAERRQAVAAILERQNREFGAGEKTLANIERLRHGAPAVVTGQQVGLFGGPLYCMLKAVAAAAQAQKADAVPVFWLATEDHDFEEINYVNLPAADHLKKFSVNVAHAEDAPVGRIVFGDEITAAVQQVQALFGDSEVAEMLAGAYRPGENFGSAFAKFYSRAFAELGIIFLDPLDADLHRVCAPVFRKALEQSESINQRLLARNEQLESAGYHAQVKVTPSHTLCFYFEDGARAPVRLENGGFVVGAHRFSGQEILAEAERCPERFSANVLLRPILQDYLLPTLFYLGGPAEIAYFAQIETVYRALAGRVTPVLPRFFATILEPRQAKLLERYRLELTDLFAGPEKLKETIAARGLPESIIRSFDVATDHLEKALQTIQEPLENLDKTLVDAAANAGSKMRHQLQTLREKAARAEARKDSETQRHADELSTLLFPNKELQEREIGAAYFLLKYGVGVVGDLKESLRQGCTEHQVVRLRAGG